jgi:hypothetical protein
MDLCAVRGKSVDQVREVHRDAAAGCLDDQRDAHRAALRGLHTLCWLRKLYRPFAMRAWRLPCRGAPPRHIDAVIHS